MKKKQKKKTVEHAHREPTSGPLAHTHTLAKKRVRTHTAKSKNFADVLTRIVVEQKAIGAS